MNTTKSLSQKRRDNLNKALNEMFSGNRQQLADAINYTTASLSQWLSISSSARSISDAVARRIENRLSLPNGYLDRSTQKNKDIYYVMVNLDGHKLNGFIHYLQTFEIVQEASALFGAQDAFLKIEASEKEFQQLLLNEVYHYPGIKDTATFKSLEALRWQKEQNESLHIIEDDKGTDFINQYLGNRTHYFMQQMKELDQGQLTIQPNDPYPIDQMTLLKNTQHTLLITTDLTKTPVKEIKSRLKIEEGLLKQGVEIKHLLICHDDKRKTMESLISDIKPSEAMQQNIRMIAKDNWRPSPASYNPEQFMAIDNQLIYLQRDECSTLFYEENKINAYLQTHSQNWHNSESPIEQLAKSHSNKTTTHEELSALTL